MPHNRKGPADANRWAFYKLSWTYPIVPFLHPETRCFLRQLAMFYREAVTSEDPRVMRLRLQILWHHLEEILQAEAE
jgi:hypothetical protein